MSETALACTTCDDPVECCAFCDEEECDRPICYGCLNEALGQAVAQPHGHGG